MNEEPRFTIEEAHRLFAKQLHGRVWELLETIGRSAAQDEEMLLAVYGSLYHWMQVGKIVHRQRGEWMIARVHLTLQNAAEALQHAQRCMELTEEFRSEMHDFDIAYANEGLARANALSGDHAVARHYLFVARAAGEAIANKEDREIFISDLNGGDWYGLN